VLLKGAVTLVGLPTIYLVRERDRRMTNGEMTNDQMTNGEMTNDQMTNDQ